MSLATSSLDARSGDAPFTVESRIALATSLAAQGRPKEAESVLLTATCLQWVKLNPADAQAHFQLGLALSHAGEDRWAARAYTAALVLAPALAEAYCNLGIALANRLANAAAARVQRRSTRLSPGNRAFQNNLAHALLATGAWTEGFAAWEGRTPSPPRDFVQPVWDGARFDGLTLLVHAEQGYGDTIQFCRFLPLVVQRGGTVIVECRASLVSVLRRIEGVDRVIAWGQPLPAFDLQVSFPSLPHRLALTHIPAPIPYLTSDATRVRQWQNRLATLPGKKIGLVWSGSARAVETGRNLPPSLLAMLRDVPNITLCSLQHGADPPPGLPCIAFGAATEDFAELSAALDCLDLLISVDTAAVHLAGALGREVWTLLPAVPDWRWLPAEGPNVWYPMMRFYRQSVAGDWQDVIAAVARDLAAFAAR